MHFLLWNSGIYLLQKNMRDARDSELETVILLGIKYDPV